MRLLIARTPRSWFRERDGAHPALQENRCFSKSAGRPRCSKFNAQTATDVHRSTSLCTCSRRRTRGDAEPREGRGRSAGKGGGGQGSMPDNPRARLRTSAAGISVGALRLILEGGPGRSAARQNPPKRVGAPRAACTEFCRTLRPSRCFATKSWRERAAHRRRRRRPSQTGTGGDVFSTSARATPVTRGRELACERSRPCDGGMGGPPRRPWKRS